MTNERKFFKKMQNKIYIYLISLKKVRKEKHIDIHGEIDMDKEGVKSWNGTTLEIKYTLIFKKWLRMKD